MHILTLATILVCSKPAHSLRHHYITPSLDIPCPHQPCLTLSQFAANSSNFAQYAGNVSLIILPGNHGLNGELSVYHVDNFSLESQEYKATFIKCASKSVRFIVNDTTLASIKGLHFIGCGNNVATTVKEFIVEDTTFQGVETEGRGTALVMNTVIYATITKCSFISNTPAVNSKYHYAREFAVRGPYLNFEDGLMSVGGALLTTQSDVSVTNTKFFYNGAHRGGVLLAYHSTVTISHCKCDHNSADIGGVIYSAESSVNVDSSTFSSNAATREINGVDNSIYAPFDAWLEMGGVMYATDGSFSITGSIFTNNTAVQNGGVMFTGDASFTVTNSTFTDNACTHAEQSSGGVIDASGGSFAITSSTFTNNSAAHGGVIGMVWVASFNITSCIFTNNTSLVTALTSTAGYGGGGVIASTEGSFTITGSTFINNFAAMWGGVILTSYTTFNVSGSTFTNNRAEEAGGVIRSEYAYAPFNVSNSSFTNNTAGSYGGIMFTTHCSARITDSTFNSNTGSLYIFNGNFTFSGYSKFKNCVERLNKTRFTRVEGGALTSVQSTVVFNGETSLLNNQARQGGAILATESTIMIYGIAIISNNTATDSRGGGISLQQSNLKLIGFCDMFDNYAMRGGGVHAKSSIIAVQEEGVFELVNNGAENGGGMYLEVNTKLHLLKTNQISSIEDYLVFFDNHANYGGAVYVDDDTNSGACSSNVECFIQIFALYNNFDAKDIDVPTNIQFFANSASEYGSNLFGGLLDRCVPSSLSEVYASYPESLLISLQPYSGVSYLQDISDITLDSIASLPIRICFCNNENESDCSFQPPPFRIKKGESLTVSLVAVDQVNNSVQANIISSLANHEGGFNEGQQIQSAERRCSDITYNVFSPHDSESINLYADGPCGGSTPSLRQLDIQFLSCSCPIGFQPSNAKSTICECVCDSRLPLYFTKCDYKTSSIVRENTNSWITYTNDTDPPGFVIHPNCPYDYCQPQTVNVSINLSLPNGSDTQCTYNRTGILCGACQEHLSLSLGSSRCLSCPSHWPAVFAAILLSAIITGILLVTALLALNVTVAVGLINGFIFYANIVAANSAVFFPSSETSFPTVFVAWLNLDLGIDVCFFDVLDTYSKTWLQLAFPVYIISLVIFVIIISERSPKFATLIGKKDPIATLATLILLSYAKLLSITITALSFAVIRYPDGTQETVWLPDGNVKYLEGKHVLLVIVTVFVILVGIPYTTLLLLWQWIIRIPIRWKIFDWTRNTKLNSFVSTYHAPYGSKHRYWTGLLLLVRVVLYITSSVTVSDNPQTSILITIIVIGALVLHKCITKIKVYKKSITEIFDTIVLFNLLALAVFSLYNFKTDSTKQTAVAYISTTVTFLLLVGVIAYHVTLVIRTHKTTRKPQAVTQSADDAMALLPLQNATVTHSIVEIIKSDQILPPEADSDPA